jgi:hypothetical protein
MSAVFYRFILMVAVFISLQLIQVNISLPCASTILYSVPIPLLAVLQCMANLDETIRATTTTTTTFHTCSHYSRCWGFTASAFFRATAAAGETGCWGTTALRIPLRGMLREEGIGLDCNLLTMSDRSKYGSLVESIRIDNLVRLNKVLGNSICDLMTLYSCQLGAVEASSEPIMVLLLI